MKKMNPENKKQRQKGVKERAENKRDKGVRKEKVMGKERTKHPLMRKKQKRNFKVSFLSEI